MNKKPKLTSEIVRSLQKKEHRRKEKKKGANKTLTQRQSKQNIIPNINERPSAAVFTDLVNQHFSLLV
jgi:hypothetical protein